MKCIDCGVRILEIENVMMNTGNKYFYDRCEECNKQFSTYTDGVYSSRVYKVMKIETNIAVFSPEEISFHYLNFEKQGYVVKYIKTVRGDFEVTTYMAGYRTMYYTKHGIETDERGNIIPLSECKR